MPGGDSRREAIQVGSRIWGVDAETKHRSCWYARRTAEFPEDIGNHTIIDGELAYCAHPMYWPVVRYEFDLRNCEDCDVFRARKSHPAYTSGRGDTPSTPES